MVADYLTESVSDGSGYVGHIGGDDFIVIFIGQNWEQNCKNTLASFKQSVLSLYSEEHKRAKGIQSVDRKGKPCFFPLLSLSIGIVESNAIVHCKSHIEIADLAAEAKHKAKKICGNSYFINRRIPCENSEQEEFYSFVA